MEWGLRRSALGIVACAAIGLLIGLKTDFSWSSIWFGWWMVAIVWTVLVVVRRRRIRKATVPSDWYRARVSALEVSSVRGRRVIPFGPRRQARDVFPPTRSRRSQVVHGVGCVVINLLLIVGFFVSVFLAYRAAPEILGRQHEGDNPSQTTPDPNRVP